MCFLSSVWYFDLITGVRQNCVTQKQLLNRARVPLSDVYTIHIYILYMTVVFVRVKFSSCAILHRSVTLHKISLISFRKCSFALTSRGVVSFRIRAYFFFLFNSAFSSFVPRSQGERLGDDEQPLPDPDDMYVVRLL